MPGQTPVGPKQIDMQSLQAVHDELFAGLDGMIAPQNEGEYILLKTKLQERLEEMGADA